MNFDKIKNLMDDDYNEGFNIPSDINLIRKSNLPIQKIRNSMKSEIITQMVFIIIFFAVLFIAELNPLPFSVYIIFMSLTSLITLLYLGKMIFFVKGTRNMETSSRATINDFIYELRLTLEVYKTAIIAGSLLLPVPMLALFFGQRTADGTDVFSKWFLLDISGLQILCVIIGFAFSVFFFYYITVKWADKLYGSHLENLEILLEELDQEGRIS